ncbi:MAG: hypothetical protein ABR550_12790, partial [Wenzhouxiangellaceae bacterium]
MQRLFDLCHSLLLSRIEFEGLTDANSNLSKRIPTAFDIFNLEKIQLQQTLKSHVRRAKLPAQL